jgi:hypothetical protein
MEGIAPSGWGTSFYCAARSVKRKTRIIGLLMVDILLMRDRRLRDSLFCICYAFGVGKWDMVGRISRKITQMGDRKEAERTVI